MIFYILSANPMRIARQQRSLTHLQTHWRLQNPLQKHLRNKKQKNKKQKHISLEKVQAQNQLFSVVFFIYLFYFLSNIT